jgi:multidrug efflux system membrane fusion protein
MHDDAAARRRRHWIFGALGALAVILIGWVVLHGKTAKPAAPPSVPVTVAKAIVQDVPISITALGAAQAWTSVTVLAQVSGKLLSVNFTEGTDVRQGPGAWPRSILRLSGRW